jgi:glycerol-3-phosphate dehydrogenase
MIGPTADVVDEKTDDFTTAENFSRILKLVEPMVNGISARDVINSFSGLRPVILEQEDFYIAPSEKVGNFIQVAGIQSPGLTASPAIGKYVVSLLENAGLVLDKKDTPRIVLEPQIESRKLSVEELAKVHDTNPGYTDWVCRCEKISEAEIIEAVRHGHTTLDGVKFYTRSGMGRCQGGFCSTAILQIISRESGIPMTELTKRGPGSELLAGKLGELEVQA